MKSVIFVGGVTGCGKSTLSKNIANLINKDKEGAVEVEADDYHSAGNKDKMSKGIGLTEEDRFPWLDKVASEISLNLKESDTVVVACSVLKKRYRDFFRDRLQPQGHRVLYLILNPERSVLEQRLTKRKGHFATASLLDSQFEAFEIPFDEPDCIVQAVFTDEDIASILASRITAKGLNDLPPELIHFLSVYLNGFELINLSRCNRHLRNFIINTKSIWTRRIGKAEAAEDCSHFGYESKLSRYFQTVISRPSGQFVGKGSSMYFPLQFNPELSFEIWFCLKKIAGVYDGGILLGCQSNNPMFNDWPHYHQQPIIIDTSLNLFASLLASEKTPLAQLSFDGMWHHLVVSLKAGASREYNESVYLDSKLLSSRSGYIHHEIASRHLTSYAQIGTGLCSASNVGKPTPQYQGWYSFNGYIDQVRTWDRAITESEVVALWQKNAEVEGSTVLNGPFFNVKHVSATWPLERFCKKYVAARTPTKQ